MSDIGTRINAIRKALGLNQRDFGEKIGISNPAVSKIEKGINMPSEQTIRSICREFNVDYFWLTKGIGSMFIEEESDPILNWLHKNIAYLI